MDITLDLCFGTATVHQAEYAPATKQLNSCPGGVTLLTSSHCSQTWVCEVIPFAKSKVPTTATLRGGQACTLPLALPLGEGAGGPGRMDQQASTSGTGEDAAGTYKARRYALKFSPPCIFLEYEDSLGKRRVRAVSDEAHGWPTALACWRRWTCAQPSTAGSSGSWTKPGGRRTGAPPNAGQAEWRATRSRR